jgi:hypothetical protein
MSSFRDTTQCDANWLTLNPLAAASSAVGGLPAWSGFRIKLVTIVTVLTMSGISARAM